MCKPTGLNKDNSPEPRGLKRGAEDEIEIVTTDLLDDFSSASDDTTGSQMDQEDDEANHHLTQEQRQDLQERRERNRLLSARARQRIRDQGARLQATDEHQSTRVTQLEHANIALMEQIQILTESKNRLLVLVEAAQNGSLHHLDLSRAAAASIPHRTVAPPPTPGTTSLDALFLLNNTHCTLSPAGFQGPTLLLAALQALSERNIALQHHISEQTTRTTDPATGMNQQQQLAALVQRHHLLKSWNIHGPNYF